MSWGFGAECLFGSLGEGGDNLRVWIRVGLFCRAEMVALDGLQLQSIIQVLTTVFSTFTKSHVSLVNNPKCTLHSKPHMKPKLA